MSSSFSGLGILIFFLALDIGALLKNIDIFNEWMLKTVAIALLIGYAVLQYTRAEKEEKVLRRKYKTSYKEYAKKTIC
jgi:protein-S-isoprenylcysteine O-methyltransferase Ste14